MSESQHPKASKSPLTRREFLVGSAAAAALPTLSAEASGTNPGTGSDSGKARRPDVVIIHADQFRWDIIGAYGLNPMGLTPNLDAMARHFVPIRHHQSAGLRAITSLPVDRAITIEAWHLEEWHWA